MLSTLLTNIDLSSVDLEEMEQAAIIAATFEKSVGKTEREGECVYVDVCARLCVCLWES